MPGLAGGLRLAMSRQMLVRGSVKEAGGGLLAGEPAAGAYIKSLAKSVLLGPRFVCPIWLNRKTFFTTGLTLWLNTKQHYDRFMDGRKRQNKRRDVLIHFWNGAAKVGPVSLPAPKWLSTVRIRASDSASSAKATRSESQTNSVSQLLLACTRLIVYDNQTCMSNRLCPWSLFAKGM